MTAEVSFNDIPQKVLDDVMEVLKNYLVALYIVPRNQTQTSARPIGSGTFMELEGSHYILTAAHVWQEVRKEKEIGLVLTDHHSSFRILRDGIVAKELWDGKLSEGWGGDLALLKLSPADVATIEARKSFLNIVQQKKDLKEHPPVIDKGAWAITGMIGEQTEVQSRPDVGVVECLIRGEASISAVQAVHEHNGYDYFDVGANLKLPGVPATFIGMSGGGLWQIKFEKTKSGEVSWDGKRYFRGVAIWQSAKKDDQRVIRCHGPKSIFEKAWDSWGLSTEKK